MVCLRSTDGAIITIFGIIVLYPRRSARTNTSAPSASNKDMDEEHVHWERIKVGENDEELKHSVVILQV